ncbi:mitochondrial inner membrane protease ATP23 homolog [Mizuhopecten yessoensis]|uniref:Mitochondrial inner membrane protease ATP23 n=1 Tax=Mizuhopecten yessoensis TaxID=6573 RepID=A0A210QRC4_MIZYE|nr:mitochondrial inner membrane protease ATP23 homolog [Mizuhopecten yessoensis]OWF51300.1 Mitochondrial inner membrane protease ATP23-like [Mizuhopecten yessoensis]
MADNKDTEQEKRDPDYAYKWFPDRGKERTSFQKIRYGRQSSSCYRRITNCMQKDRTIALIVNALNSYGCKFDRRHISCETCNEGQAAYDFRARQVVFCQNKVKSSGYCGILAHELIHAFDDCRAKVDYKNVDHIACTEIRAANLTQCDFFNGLVCGVVTPGLDKSQQACVRGHAMYSLMMSRNLSKEKALEAIDRVWDRCYNDLEPIGRRYKPNKEDRSIASHEARKFGF